MADRLLARTGAEHHQHQQPKDRHTKQREQAAADRSVIGQRAYRRPRKKDNIQHGNARPQQREIPPIFDSERSKKRGREQNNTDMSPTVERVEQAHRFLLVIGRTRLDYRADKHLDKPTADGIDHDRDKDPGICARQQLGQHRQRDESDRRADMSEYHRCPIPYPIYKARRQHVYEQLDKKIYRDEQRYPRQRDSVAALKGHEKKRNEIIDYRLNNVSDKAGIGRFFIVRIHI